MPRASRSLNEDDKKKRRREQKKLSMRRVREKLSETAIAEIRKKDRERYHRKKAKGEIKTIDQYTPREQRKIRKMWREKAKKRRELLKMQKATAILLEENTPPSSPSSSFSRIEVGRAIAVRNKKKIKAENIRLKLRNLELSRKLNKYRMRIKRLQTRKNKAVTQNNMNDFQKKVKIDVKKAVHDFLLEDEYSRLTSAKNETITRKKSKHQIRLLNDTLLNLHKIFQTKTGIKISYQTFRRYRPFWVLFPKASLRNTCLCIVHENNDLIVRALQKAKIIFHGSASDVAKALCCNYALNLKCLERTCSDCQNKQILFNTYNDNDYINYERWVTKNVEVIVKGKEKQVKKTLKETVKTTKKSLVQIFKLNILGFMQHQANLLHQIRSIQILKQQLSPSEGLLHIDFSENYNCKYSTEVQSAHFGGSKDQLTLHTCIYYSTESEPPDNYLKTSPMCTVSENLRHDPVMICVHLKPILSRIKELSPRITELHILSDGPSSQYRNKSMFHLIANYISIEINVNTIIWHYSEKGHGKGAPDGVGGCIKRLCDNSVAMGKDISSYDSFMSCLRENCKGIEIYEIEDSNIYKIEEILERSKTKPFKGTLRVHQLTWSRREPNILHARWLSCLVCAAHRVCPHFEIGQIKLECERLILNSPRTSDSRKNISPNDNVRVATPDASTISNSPTPPGTPENFFRERFFQVAPNRPKKRQEVICNDSDSSDSIFVSPPPRRRLDIAIVDSEEEETIF